MYLDYFGLREAPFRITPHTEFFFGGGNRGATLDALLYAITHEDGIVKVCGEVGTGKTMLCRVLGDRLPDTVDIIYLANPSLSRSDILFAIAHELQIEVPGDMRAAAVLRQIQEQLILSYSEGRQVVVLIDEAHAMPAETLEEIRLLSNLESNRSKLLQLVLFGQPELNEVLARSDMRQLKERVTHNFTLEPLPREEIAAYLDFRLRAAGYKGPSPFDAKAISQIARTSRGLIRRVNILADKCLLAAFAEGTHRVGTRELRTAIRDCDFSNAVSAHEFLPATKRLAGWGTILVAVILGVAAGALLDVGKQALTGAPGESVDASSAVKDAGLHSQVRSTSSAGNNLQASNKMSFSPEFKGSLDGLPQGAGTLTKSAVSAGIAWQENARDTNWFIQLLIVDGEQVHALEAFLQKAVSSGLDQGELRVYRASVGARPRYGVTYGDFEERKSAQSQLDALPGAIKVSRPFLRQVGQLR